MNVDSAAELAAVSPSPVAPSESTSSRWSPGTGSSQNLRAMSDDGASWPIERWCLRRVIGVCGNPPVRVQLWDGTEIAPFEGAASGTVQIANRRTLWRLFLDPRVVFGDAYSEGTLRVQGSLVDVLSAICGAVMRISPHGMLGHFVHRPRRARSHSLAASRDSVEHHYDIGNNFYQLWLDERMQYTCAYYARQNFNLDEAQLAKLDHVCRKLQLQPGQSVVEAGCGWGGLALHMAERYGVTVRAFNLSREQVAFARSRAAVLGLSRRVEFIQDDYRNVTGKYDVFVSVGMLEHVGRENLGELGRVIDRSLTPSGRGLIHAIGRNRPQSLDPWTARRIFPGAYPPSLGEMVRILEPFRFSVLDVENLRLHYARTLEHWLERFEYNIGKIAALFDERFVRMWRMYLAGSLATFKVGGLQLFQVVFARESNNDVPWTRRHLYDAEECASGLPA